jgi:phage terminase large subunit-like protein
VRAIRYRGFGPYYDLTVPDLGNYLAEGFWHHNSGKTRPGAEQVSEWARLTPKARIGGVAPTIADFRDVMVEGESGLLSVLPPSALRGYSVATAWNRSQMEFHFSNGAQLKGFSSEKPGSIRGKNLSHAWVDEPAELKDSFIEPTKDTTWSNLMLSLRLGKHPQCIVTGTPKPVALIKYLLAHPRVTWVRFSTYRNLGNLAPTFREEILSMYEGTTLGRQELHAELIEAVEGALWTPAMCDDGRWSERDEEGAITVPRMLRKVIALDPSMGGEAGIVVCGSAANGKVYAIADLSKKARRSEWARICVEAYWREEAFAVIAERNLPPLQETTDIIRSVPPGVDPLTGEKHPGGASVRIIPVNAREGKAARAGPVVTIWEQHKCGIVGGLPDLESQLCTWIPPGQPDASNWSPNRLDAMVWGMTYLRIRRPQRHARTGSSARERQVPALSV